ncbi:MAG: TetR/AcrR family transcriptional regulator [bacterium]
MAETIIKERSWQAEKSENTRNAVMEATVRCYIDHGYTNTTVTKIAEHAGVSRGAMMHHFDDRREIISASVKYLTKRRLDEFRNLMGSAAISNRDVVNEENIRSTVNALWKFFHIPSYIAFQELLLAARTDPELAEAVTPAQKELDQRITESIRAMFPVWEAIEPVREVITDLLFYTLQGMAISKITNKSQPRVQNLLELLVRETCNLYERSVAGS